MSLPTAPAATLAISIPINFMPTVLTNCSLEYVPNALWAKFGIHLKGAKIHADEFNVTVTLPSGIYNQEPLSIALGCSQQAMMDELARCVNACIKRLIPSDLDPTPLGAD